MARIEANVVGANSETRERLTETFTRSNPAARHASICAIA